MFKRFLVSLLIVSTIFTSVPTTAFAAGDISPDETIEQTQEAEEDVASEDAGDENTDENIGGSTETQSQEAIVTNAVTDEEIPTPAITETVSEQSPSENIATPTEEVKEDEGNTGDADDQGEKKDDETSANVYVDPVSNDIPSEETAPVMMTSAPKKAALGGSRYTNVYYETKLEHVTRASKVVSIFLTGTETTFENFVSNYTLEDGYEITEFLITYNDGSTKTLKSGDTIIVNKEFNVSPTITSKGKTYTINISLTNDAPGYYLDSNKKSYTVDSLPTTVTLDKVEEYVAANDGYKLVGFRVKGDASVKTEHTFDSIKSGNEHVYPVFEEDNTIRVDVELTDHVSYKDPNVTSIYVERGSYILTTNILSILDVEEDYNVLGFKVNGTTYNSYPTYGFNYKSMTVTAVATEKPKKNISVDFDGGVDKDGNTSFTTSIKTGESYTLTEAFGNSITKSGYVFDGYIVNRKNQGKSYTINAFNTSKVNVTIAWKKINFNTYTIKLQGTNANQLSFKDSNDTAFYVYENGDKLVIDSAALNSKLNVPRGYEIYGFQLDSIYSSYLYTEEYGYKSYNGNHNVYPLVREAKTDVNFRDCESIKGKVNVDSKKLDYVKNDVITLDETFFNTHFSIKDSNYEIIGYEVYNNIDYGAVLTIKDLSKSESLTLTADHYYIYPLLKEKPHTITIHLNGATINGEDTFVVTDQGTSINFNLSTDNIAKLGTYVAKPNADIAGFYTDKDRTVRSSVTLSNITEDRHIYVSWTDYSKITFKKSNRTGTNSHATPKTDNVGYASRVKNTNVTSDLVSQYYDIDEGYVISGITIYSNGVEITTLSSLPKDYKFANSTYTIMPILKEDPNATFTVTVNLPEHVTKNGESSYTASVKKGNNLVINFSDLTITDGYVIDGATVNGTNVNNDASGKSITIKNITKTTSVTLKEKYNVRIIKDFVTKSIPYDGNGHKWTEFVEADSLKQISDLSYIGKSFDGNNADNLVEPGTYKIFVACASSNVKFEFENPYVKDGVPQKTAYLFEVTIEAPKTHNVTVDYNGGVNPQGETSSQYTVDDGSKFTKSIDDYKFVKYEGYKLVGFEVDGATVDTLDITVNADTNVKLVWAKTYTITVNVSNYKGDGYQGQPKFIEEVCEGDTFTFDYSTLDIAKYYSVYSVNVDGSWLHGDFKNPLKLEGVNKDYTVDIQISPKDYTICLTEADGNKDFIISGTYNYYRSIDDFELLADFAKEKISFKDHYSLDVLTCDGDDVTSLTIHELIQNYEADSQDIITVYVSAKEDPKRTITVDYNGGVNPQGETSSQYIEYVGDSFERTINDYNFVTREGYKIVGFEVDGITYETLSLIVDSDVTVKLVWDVQTNPVIINLPEHVTYNGENQIIEYVPYGESFTLEYSDLTIDPCYELTELYIMGSPVGLGDKIYIDSVIETIFVGLDVEPIEYTIEFVGGDDHCHAKSVNSFTATIDLDNGYIIGDLISRYIESDEHFFIDPDSAMWGNDLCLDRSIDSMIEEAFEKGEKTIVISVSTYEEEKVTVRIYSFDTYGQNKYFEVYVDSEFTFPEKSELGFSNPRELMYYDGNGNQYNTGDIITVDGFMNFDCIWKPLEYNVTVDYNGGKDGEGKTSYEKTYLEDEGDVFDPDFFDYVTYDGYDLVGFQKVNSDGTLGNVEDCINTYDLTSDVKYQFVWEKKSYDLSIYFDGASYDGENSITTTVTYGDSYTIDTSKISDTTGKKLTTVMINNDNVDVNDFNFVISDIIDNTEVNLIWEYEDYTVTFIPEDYCEYKDSDITSFEYNYTTGLAIDHNVIDSYIDSIDDSIYVFDHFEIDGKSYDAISWPENIGDVEVHVYYKTGTGYICIVGENIHIPGDCKIPYDLGSDVVIDEDFISKYVEVYDGCVLDSFIVDGTSYAIDETAKLEKYTLPINLYVIAVKTYDVDFVTKEGCKFKDGFSGKYQGKETESLEVSESYLSSIIEASDDTYVFSYFTVNDEETKYSGDDIVTISTYCSVEVYYEKKDATVTYTCTLPDSLTINDTAKYSSTYSIDSDKILEFYTLPTGFYIDYFEVDGVKYEADKVCTIDDINKDNYNVRVVVETYKYTITYVPEENCKILDGAYNPQQWSYGVGFTIDYDKEIKYVVGPLNENCEYAYFTINDDPTPRTTYKTSGKLEDVTVHVYYTRKQCEVSYTCTNGTVVDGGKLNVPMGDNYTVNATEIAKYTKANDNFILDSFEVDGKTYKADETCVITNIKEAKEVKVNFVEIYKVKFVAEDNCKLIDSSKDEIVVLKTDDIIVSKELIEEYVEANDDTYVFDYYTIDDGKSHYDSLTDYYITGKSADSENVIHVNYKKATYDVTFTNDGNATIKDGANTKVTYEVGSKVVIDRDSIEEIFEPAEGYKLDSFTVDGVKYGANESYSIDSISSNVKVVANYAKITFTITIDLNGGIDTSNSITLVNTVEYGDEFVNPKLDDVKLENFVIDSLTVTDSKGNVVTNYDEALKSVKDNYNVKLNWKQYYFLVTLDPGDHGVIRNGVKQSYYSFFVLADTSAMYNDLIVDEGWYIDYLTVNDDPTHYEYIFEDITEDIVIKVHYAQMTEEIILKANNGGLDSDIKLQVPYGDWTVPNCEFKAPNGKEFDYWKVEFTKEPIKPMLGIGIVPTDGMKVKPGDVLFVKGNITLVAVYKDKPSDPKPNDPTPNDPKPNDPTPNGPVPNGGNTTNPVPTNGGIISWILPQTGGVETSWYGVIIPAVSLIAIGSVLLAFLKKKSKKEQN